MSLVVQDLSVARGPRRVIDGLTLPAFPKGEFAVIAGPNAAGKSTLLRAVAGACTEWRSGSVPVSLTFVVHTDTVSVRSTYRQRF